MGRNQNPFWPYVNFISWDAGVDPLTDADYDAIVARINPNLNFLSGALDSAKWELKSRHFLYFKNDPNGIPHVHNGVILDYGTCGNSSINSNNAGLQTVADISKVTQIGGLAFSSIGIAVPAITGEALASGLAAASGIFGLATFGIGLVLAPLAFIFAHHAKAVALEQGDLCGAFRQLNPLLDDIDQNFYAGKITLAQASQGLDNLYAGLVQALQPIEKPCNAACIMEEFLRLENIMRKEYLYPQFASKAQKKVSSNLIILLVILAVIFFGKSLFGRSTI